MRIRFAARRARCIVSRARWRRWTLLGVLAAMMCVCLPLPMSGHAQSICAEVKIEIDQKVGLERQAFDAVLKIHNGLDGVQVENLGVTLSYKDSSGSDASSLFVAVPGAISGISGAINGSGTVAASSSGEAHWLIIPSPGAGGTGSIGRNYQVGATVQYRMTGETDLRTIVVTPEIITVRPQSLLVLDYFLAGDVYADDPNTLDEREPPVPFTLGLRVKNVGAGDAAHLTIDSAQPRIDPINNPQGLLVHFQIIGGYVDDQATQPSLMLDFGGVAAAQSRMGRWVMQTDISGRFTDFTAEFTHSDALGGALTSLIQSVNTHLLAHDVVVDLPQRDRIRDFLALDGTDPDVDTYRVYESNGIDTVVATRFDANFNVNSATLSFQPGGSVPVYARAPINFDGQTLTILGCREIPFSSPPRCTPIDPANVWFSKRRDPSGDHWLYFVNLFEPNSSACDTTACTYDLSYDRGVQPGSIAGVVYADANANGGLDQGETGIGGVNVYASNGSEIQSAVTAADGSFLIEGLDPNTYTLSVDPVAGYYDGASTIGNGGGTAGTGTIGDITITSGLSATGYLFAKVPQPVQQVADLAITALTSSTSTPRVGETFAITLQVANAGPDAAIADAGITLPASITVQSSSASTGTFDPASGHWAVGNLPAQGTATLTLQASATATGNATVGASIQSNDASILDPNTANNISSLSLDVHPATEVHIDASFASRPRVLALTACAPGGGASGDCAAKRADALENYARSKGIDVLATDSPSEFRDEMRSGHWNVYWIDNGSTAPNGATLTELRLAVMRGDSLIADGTSLDGTSKINQFLGVSSSSSTGNSTPRAITFVPNDYLNVSGLVVTTPQYLYTTITATTLATYPDSTPAVTFQPRGNGRSFLLTFDFITALANDNSFGALFDQLMMAARPPIPTFLMPDAHVSIDVHLENAGNSASLDETLNVPAGGHVLAAVPLPRGFTDTQVLWRNHLASGATFDSSVELRTPPSGSSPVTVDVTQVDGDGTNLAHQDLVLAIRTVATQGQYVSNDIAALDVQGSTDTNLKSTATSSVEKALAQFQSGAYDTALSDVALADDSLQAIVSADTTVARIDLGWLLQAMQRSWYKALATCTTPAIPPAVNSGLSFVPFAAHEGLDLHQINPGGFEWRLGSDTTSSTNSVGGTTALTNGQVYVWTLTYDGSGNGSLTVRRGLTILLNKSFTGSGNAMLDAGNALQLFVKVLGGTVSNGITVHATSVDGATATGTLSVTTTGTVANQSLFYYGESLRDGFSLSGDVTVAGVTGVNPPVRISFLVNAGMLSCQLAGR